MEDVSLTGSSFDFDLSLHFPRVSGKRSNIFPYASRRAVAAPRPAPIIHGNGRPRSAAPLCDFSALLPDLQPPNFFQNVLEMGLQADMNLWLADLLTASTICRRDSNSMKISRACEGKR